MKAMRIVSKNEKTEKSYLFSKNIAGWGEGYLAGIVWKVT